MNLPGYQADTELGQELIDLHFSAELEEKFNWARSVFGAAEKTEAANRYTRALTNAWEAGRLCPVKNLTLLEEDKDNAI